jgi:CheY-like chemotaxis protein
MNPNPNATVLIVDDEPGIRLVFRTALEAMGHRTLEAADGAAALGVLAGSVPDVVLLDLKMPVMDGMETLRRMRDSGYESAVVIVTAHGSVPDAVAAMKLGAVDFLSKPITPDALRRVVAEVSSRHDKAEPVQQPAAGKPQRAAKDSPPFLDYSSVTALVAPPVVDLREVKQAIYRRDLSRARELLEEVLERFPDSLEALNLSGVLHEALGDNHAAYWAYRTALELDRGCKPALDNLRRYCERQGLDFSSKAINPTAR